MSGHQAESQSPTLYIIDASLGLTTQPLSEVTQSVLLAGGFHTEGGLAVLQRYLRPGALGALRYLFDQSQRILFSSTDTSEELLKPLLSQVFNASEVQVLLEDSYCPSDNVGNVAKEYGVNFILKEAEDSITRVVVVDPALYPNSDYFLRFEKTTLEQFQTLGRRFVVESFTERTGVQAWAFCIDQSITSVRSDATPVLGSKALTQAYQLLQEDTDRVSVHSTDYGYLVFSYYLREHDRVYSEYFAYSQDPSAGKTLKVIPYSEDQDVWARTIQNMEQDPHFCPITARMVAQNPDLSRILLDWKLSNAWGLSERTFLTNKDLVTAVIQAKLAAESDSEDEYEEDFDDHDDHDDEEASTTGLAGDVATLPGQLTQKETEYFTVLGDGSSAVHEAVGPGVRHPTKRSAEDSTSQIYMNISSDVISVEEEKRIKLEIIEELMSSIDWTVHANLFRSEKDSLLKGKKIPSEAKAIKEILADTEASVTLRYARLEAKALEIETSLVGKFIRFMMSTALLRWLAPRSSVTHEMMNLIGSVNQVSIEGVQTLADTIKNKVQTKTKKSEVDIRHFRAGSTKSATHRLGEESEGPEIVATPSQALTGDRPVLRDPISCTEERERVKQLSLTTAAQDESSTQDNSPDSSLSFSDRQEIANASMKRRLVVPPKGGVHMDDHHGIFETAGLPAEAIPPSIVMESDLNNATLVTKKSSRLAMAFLWSRNHPATQSTPTVEASA